MFYIHWCRERETTTPSTNQVEQLFQMWGTDVMELPRTARGNKYVIIIQDFLTKWPLVFPAPDQPTE